MINSSRFKITLMLAAVFILCATSFAQAEEYEWLKSQDYKQIFVYTNYSGCDFIVDKLNETVKRTFSRYNIKATISNSMTFKTTEESKDSTYELLDDNLISNNKIILSIYGKCIRYTSGFIYQFDIHFGINNKKYSQALLYSIPQHSVIGVDSATGIDRTFRELMKNAVDDYVSANQQQRKN